MDDREHYTTGDAADISMEKQLLKNYGAKDITVRQISADNFLMKWNGPHLSDIIELDRELFWDEFDEQEVLLLFWYDLDSVIKRGRSIYGLTDFSHFIHMWT